MEPSVSDEMRRPPLRRSTRQPSGPVKDSSAGTDEPTPRGSRKGTRKVFKKQQPTAPAVNDSGDVDTGSGDDVVTDEPTPRGSLKRTREERKQAPALAVNGSRDVETGSDDDNSPSKKSRTETGRPMDDLGDENEIEMDVQESGDNLKNDEDQEMDNIEDSSHETHQPTTCHGNRGDINLDPRVMLGERHKPSLAANEESDLKKTKRVKPSTKEPVAPPKSAAQIRPPANIHDVSVTSMADYKRKMEAKATGVPKVNHHVPRVYPASERSYTTGQRLNNITTRKEPAQNKKQGKTKAAVTKKSSGYSCRGFIWHLVLLVLLCSALLLACKIIPVLENTADGGKHPSTAVKPEIFADHLSLLETQFPRQRPELWRMSKIHLEKHLQSAQPTEPVSLIFTAGRRAERTLHCLAQRLAASFSSALNASVLHIDGASKASQDSDEVKLDIDSQLQAAFEGNKPVAIIHRFEELPPGSTLIFYRYCDHENAAYKRVFLLFTVLLPQDEVTGGQSLKDLEEMVYEYVKERLVDSSNETGFNDMDMDKYGGLWSRISHLILPVVSEKEVEQKGC